MACFAYRTSIARALSCLAACWLTIACGPQGATPVPQPPLGAFPLDSIATPKVDPDTRNVVVLSSRPMGSSKGSPVPGGLIRVTDLDSTASPVQTTVDDAGAFSLSLPFALGDELRFEWLLDGQRSTPADAVLTSGPAALALVPSPRFACLGVEPAYFVGFGSATRAELTLTNRCGSAVTVDGPRTRLGLADFALDPALPLTVPGAANAALSFTFERSTAGIREDVLFVDVTLAGESVRYPITLSSDAPLGG